MISKQEARSLVRKAVKRVPEGEEVRHLNIMPMMDIMTILLVAFIFQAATGAAAITAGSVDLPGSRSPEELPEGANVVVITPESIVVEGESLLSVSDGDVSPDEKGGVNKAQIPRLSRFLGQLRQADIEELQVEGKPMPDDWDLMVIADETTPYRLLLSVIVSAAHEEAGFTRFRLIVMSEDSAPAAPQ